MIPAVICEILILRDVNITHSNVTRGGNVTVVHLAPAALIGLRSVNIPAERRELF